MTATTCYETIKARIRTGEVEGGTWLREALVAAALGASRTPVREALRLLASEGLVELVPNRGARVVRWTADDVEETYSLRAVLEGHGAGLAAQRARPDEVDRMVAAEETYEAALAGGAPRAIAARCNDAFHAAVLEAARSARLERLLGVLWSTPLTTQALGSYDDADRSRSTLQHRDILTAIGHRDVALASTAMRSHILAARYSAFGRPDHAAATTP